MDKDEGVIRTEDCEQIAFLRAHIAEHYAGDVTIAALSRVARMSPTKLKRCFRLLTGVTVHVYVTRTRIENAMRMIREEELSLGSVAVRVGFRKQGTLSAAFAKHIGMSPREYRKRNRAAARGK